MKQSRFAEVVEACGALSPDAVPDHELLLGHATALFSLRRPAEAVPVFLRCLSLDLTNPIAHFRMGLAFRDMTRDRDANLCFQTALATDTSGRMRALVLSQLVYSSRLACEWDELEDHTAQLLSAIDTADETGGDMVGSQLSPFTLLAIDATPEQQLRVGRLAAHASTHSIVPLPAPGPRRPGRVRVGYLSSDFFYHATALLMTELLERRDTGRFEVFLYSHSFEDGSEIQKRVRAAADHYLDVTSLSDVDIAQRMRADGIDIAIDLKGHTRDTRFGLLAYRPAPVQVAYLGYPGSSGAGFIDYLIGDEIVTPLAHAPQYSEKIAQLPDSYQPNDRKRALPPRPTREVEGLPEDAVVLCCFNQTYKISPHMLDLWARILNGAPNTVLWMLTWTHHGHVNLSKELEARGVSLDRVLFAPKVQVDDHIARLRCADLFLDTFPCNAHTTASEALWAGVPVLTTPGRTYASRVAASLVSACGLPELACADADEYVNAAIRFAQEPERLRAAQAHLEKNRMSLPLFDTDRYARDYEALLMRMFDRHQQGLAPDHLPSMRADEVVLPPAVETPVTPSPAVRAGPEAARAVLPQVQTPLVSFCIPTYKRSRYLAALLQSLSEQFDGFPYPFEVVIADNASPDNTRDVVDGFVGSMPIRYLRHAENIGGLPNWQFVMSQAMGRYVVYVSDDDLLIIDEVAKTIAKMEADPDVVVVYAPWNMFDKVAQQQQGQFYNVPHDLRIERNQQAKMLDHVLRHHIFPEVQITRREVLQRLMPRINDHAYSAFVHVADYLSQGAVLIQKTPYYTAITRYFEDENRDQIGNDEVEVAWDRYRGGLEYLLARAGKVSEGERTKLHMRIQHMIALRMSVAIRLRHQRKRDPIDTFMLAMRLRGMGHEAMLPVPMAALANDAALHFFLSDPVLNRGVKRLVCVGDFEPALKALLQERAPHPVSFADAMPPVSDMDDTLVLVRDNVKTVPEDDAALSARNCRVVQESVVIQKFAVA
jgi:predicted O-linked N-acetylglucosamine transferase (SPINDLY family)/glycosyltransferase involved in cell wall biosynthesis